MSCTKHKPSSLFVLIDCNNFYASCERVFDPKLIGKPIVVLSNNDGCIVARSKEAKQLGIPMGAPVFEWKQVITQHKVVVRSSNYALYGDMSQRVMSSLAQFSSEMEIYSIDEAFLMFPVETSLEALHEIRKKVLQWTGIPISLGVGETKTLAKLANRLAKDSAGVFFLVDELKRAEIFEKLPVGEVWGIGSRTTAKLNACGVWTVADLIRADDVWIRKNFTVVLLRTVWELRGISCIGVEEIAASKKSIICSRSFGKVVKEYEDIAEALSMHVACAAEKARHQNSLVSYLEVFILTNIHKPNQAYYSNKHLIVLSEPSAHTPTLIHYAKMSLQKIFRTGLDYKKVGVIFGGLVPEHSYQRDLFTKTPEKHRELMAFLDETNKRYGKKVLKFAAEGVVQPWKMKREQCSPCFTTRWEDLLKIKI